MSLQVKLTQPPEILKLLAHNIRWQLVVALTESDFQVNELVELLDEKMNLLSYHLKKLRHEEIVTMRRSDSDSRDVYYSLNLDHLKQTFSQSGAMLHPALACQADATVIDEEPLLMTQNKKLRILFLCTHNAARSQMAEGLMRHYGGDLVEVYSAGHAPTRVHSRAIKVLDQRGIDIRDQYAKPVSEFQGQEFDYVITVCDVAKEVCPSFEGDVQRLHWGFSNPLAIRDEVERDKVFQDIATRLETRVQYFLRTIS